MELMSAVLIVPSVALEGANRLAEGMGWGPSTFTVPLSSGGDGISHHACRADVTGQFVSQVQDLQAGVLPEGVPEEALAVASVLFADFAPVTSRMTHMADVLASRGLFRTGG